MYHPRVFARLRHLHTHTNEKGEKGNKERINALEIRQDSKCVLVAALDERQQQQSPKVEALILALPPHSDPVQALIEA